MPENELSLASMWGRPPLWAGWAATAVHGNAGVRPAGGVRRRAFLDIALMKCSRPGCDGGMARQVSTAA